MNFSERIARYAAEANDGNREAPAGTMPGACRFLNRDTVLCGRRDFGDSRYPYCVDGFTLWAYAGGYISVNESTFYVLLPGSAGREPYATFFGGLKKSDGTFEPVSLLSVTRLPGESPCTRSTVYTPQAAYYVADTAEITFGLRVFVRPEREMCYSLTAVNKTDKKQEIYLSSMLGCLLMHGSCETIETNWFRECRATDTGYVFESVEDVSRTVHLTHYGIVQRCVPAGARVKTTCARSVFTGGTNNPVILSPSLRCGAFSFEQRNCKFTDTPVAGDIVLSELAPYGAATVDYTLTVRCDALGKEASMKKNLTAEELDAWIEAAERRDKQKFEADGMLKMRLDGMRAKKFSDDTFDNFLRSVMRQVEFAALAKNSGISLLGVRDVFQQIEAALLWNAPACRSKILEALNFIGDNGRPPRQYSIPPSAEALPRLDLRAFIDQGAWIVNTVYAYLSATGDYSVLDEVCGYCKFLPDGGISRSGKADSVLTHLVRITDYMVSNIDGETDCLKALYGDWNDALDGLGVSTDPNKEFGTGVSVMASLQLYQNLREMREIIGRVNGDETLEKKYESVQNRLYKGLKGNAVEISGGKRKILHGWGDGRAYRVGSFCDGDGRERDGLTSNAFWAISDLLRSDSPQELAEDKKTILAAYERLDGKYGLKTFEPYFPKNMKGVGRIVNLPVGTAENAATYVHATLFGIWSLFKLGEGEKAWKQLYKILPLTHENISTTPFVMPNSYSFNEEYGMDGESMSDWFTGSANVLVKVMVRYVFGVETRLDRVILQPATYFPADVGVIDIRVREADFHIVRRKTTHGKRLFTVNGTAADGYVDAVDGVTKLEISTDGLRGKITVEITD